MGQPALAHHKLHGTRVLAHHEYDNTWRVYFLDSNVVSQQMSILALSYGWPAYSPRDQRVHDLELVLKGFVRNEVNISGAARMYVHAARLLLKETQ